MKICFLTPTVSIGGYEKFLLNIMREIYEEFEIYTIANNAIGDNKEVFEEVSTIIDLKVNRVRYMFFKLYKKLKTIKPDIVYVSFPQYVFIVNLIRAVFRFKFKVIVGEHLLTQPKSKVSKLLFKWAYKKSDEIIAVSEFAKNNLANNLNLNDISVIYNPIINEELKREFNKEFNHEWLNGNYKVIALLGRMAEDKGFQFVLEAFSLVDDKKDKKILIIGDGPYKKELETLSEKLELDEYVDFLGFIKQPISILKKCDCLIVFSDYETFGNTVVEALYAYCEVITYRGVGGPEEIINNEKLGKIINCRDIRELANEIDKIKKKDMEYIRRERALEYSSEKIVKEYKKKLNKVIYK